MDIPLNSTFLFGYSTSDGYSNGCYNQDPATNSTNECGPAWMAASTPPMMLGHVLAANVAMEPYSQEDLSIEVAYTSSEWWVYAAINGTPQAIGYFETSGYAGGAMGNGEAQEYQVGGEVDDQAVYNSNNPNDFTIPMGSGLSASEGYESAAYVAQAEACTPDFCHEPTSISTVTVPKAYDYAVGLAIPPEFGTDDVGFFYLGTGTNTYTWHGGYLGNGWPPLPLGSTEPPLIRTPYTFFPLTLGANQIPIAPRFIYDSSIGEEKFNLDVITPIENDSSGNYLVEGFSTEPDGLVDPFDYRQVCGGSDWYMAGLTSDYYNYPVSNGSDSGKIWGWGSGYGLWTNDPTFSCIQEVAHPFTSVAVFSDLNVVATSQSSSCTSLQPWGPCIYSGFLEGSTYELSKTSFGAEQVVFDSITTDAYALSEGGSVIRNWDGQNGGSPTNLGHTTCGNSAITFVEIAAKNGVVFALGEYGTVYFLGGTVTCWTALNDVEYPQFVAIATDNDFFLGPIVWGVDYAGYLWAAQ